MHSAKKKRSVDRGMDSGGLVDTGPGGWDLPTIGEKYGALKATLVDPPSLAVTALSCSLSSGSRGWSGTARGAGDQLPGPAGSRGVGGLCRRTLLSRYPPASC